MKTVFTTSELPSLIKKIKHEDKSIVVTGGCFDVLHIGHITLLANAKKEGDILVVLLEPDATIKKKGANRPIHTQEERAKLLTALHAVDIVVLLDEKMQDRDYDKLLAIIAPQVIAVTEEDPHMYHKKRQADAIGAKILAVNKYIPSVSTTKLLDILSKEK